MSNTNAVFQDKNYNYPADKSSISTLNPQGNRTRVPQNNSDWINSLSIRFNELTSLPMGWDGYSGKPVSFINAQFAANLIEQLFTQDIPPPQLVPGSDGTLQIEWHLNRMDIEIDILKPYNVIATIYNHISDEDDEIELQTDYTKLVEWLNELKQNNQEQQQAL